MSNFFKNNRETILWTSVFIVAILTLFVTYIIIKDEDDRPTPVSHKATGVIPGIDPKAKLRYMRENGQVYPVDPRTNTALKFDPASNAPIVITPQAGNYLMSVQDKADAQALIRQK